MKIKEELSAIVNQSFYVYLKDRNITLKASLLKKRKVMQIKAYDNTYFGEVNIVSFGKKIHTIEFCSKILKNEEAKILVNELITILGNDVNDCSYWNRLDEEKITTLNSILRYWCFDDKNQLVEEGEDQYNVTLLINSSLFSTLQIVNYDSFLNRSHQVF